MKALTLVMALCVLSQSATAQAIECRNIPSSKARLDCYDKPAPASNVRTEKQLAASK